MTTISIHPFRKRPTTEISVSGMERNKDIIPAVPLCLPHVVVEQVEEMSSEFKQLIRDIKPGFEENLVRAFKNEAIRNQQIINNNSFLHKMDNILLPLDDSKIELSNLKFPWIPDFRIITMSVDLNMMCLDVAFKIGDLRVEGEYEATNMTLQRLLPITNNGKIEVTFKDVSAKGRVGLLIRGDSLVPENYDIGYESSGTSLSVKYYISPENEIENKVVRPNGDDTIGNAIKIQLTTLLTNMLHRQLAEAVVQFSLAELMEDEDEQLRELAQEHTSRANKLLDSLLCSAKYHLVARNLRSIETPSFNVVYRGKLSGVFQGNMQTGPGYIQDLSTLSRLQDLSLFEDSEELVVYGSLSLREMKHGYEHYNSNFEDTQISGRIRTSIYENKIFIKLTVHKGGEHCKTQLENVQVITVKDIDVDASGLASLSWLVPKVESWVIGNLRYNALPVLERHIKEAFDYAIAKTDCVALLFD